MSPATITLSSTAPSITAANGSNNPSALHLGSSSANAAIQQLAFVNSSATSDIITSIQVTPTGNVLEGSAYTVKIWKEGATGTMGAVDSSDTQLLLSSGAWAGTGNETTTFTITGGGFRIDGSATTNFLFSVTGNGTAAGDQTHGHQVPISGITELSGTNVTLASGQSDPLTSATGTVDATPPTILSVYSTSSGAVDITFGEPIDDSTFSTSDFELDSDTTNGTNSCDNPNYIECDGNSGSTSVTYPSADTDSNDEYYHVSANGPAVTGLIYLHYDGTSLKDVAGNSLAACSACGTEYDRAAPSVVSGMSGGITGGTDTNGRNKLTFIFTENIFVDNTNRDGTLDAGDTTDGESVTSTSSFGGFWQLDGEYAHWVAEGVLRMMGGGGDVAQSSEACNTLSVSGATLTVTFNTVAECYFSGTSWPNVSSGVQLDDMATKNTLVYATEGSTLALRQLPLTSTYLAGDQLASWDKTAPSAVTAGEGTATATTATPTWTAITDAHFGEYIVAYRTTTGVTISNGTLWSSADDATLAIATTASTTITGLTAGTTYYYVVYARDSAGNLSTASTEKTVTVTSGGSSIPMDAVPPGVPLYVTATANSNNQVVINWTDPIDLDLNKIYILKGKNGQPISGAPIATVGKGIKTYTDTDVAVGDRLEYVLKASDEYNNYSNLTTAVSVTVPTIAQQQILKQQETTQVQTPLTVEEKNLIADQIALLEKLIKRIDQVSALYNTQIKKLNKKKDAKKISAIKSVMRRINKNKAKQILKLNELKAKLAL